MSDFRHLLRELHALHLRIKTLRDEAEQGPQKLRKYQAKIDHQQRLFSETQETIKHLKVTIHEKEVTLKGNLQKITKHQQQMNEASSKKEYDALRSEIDHERQANRVLEDEILEAMGALEEKTQQLPALEKALEQAREEYGKAEQEIAGRQSGLQQRLAEVNGVLESTEAGLSGEVRLQYRRLVQARGDDALAPVNGQTCSGCYTEITPQNYQDLRAGRLVACKNCGRLLYLPE
jgi:predicted  nucleic acid-binding Zn-ribbon protein